MGKSNRSKAAQDNRANQLNPEHSAYHRARGTSKEAASKEARSSKTCLDNRSNQLNPNNPKHTGPLGEGKGNSEPSPSNDE